jgi:fructose-1-phosphate kinase PfkB-like protein
MTATQANQAVNAIKAMNPSVATPSTVGSGSPITAAFINGLANSLNSL